MEREHKATEAVTKDPFDRMLSSMIGVPNGAHTQPSVVQHIDFYGNATSYMIQTCRTEQGVVAFVTQVTAQGSVRYMLPHSVLQTIDRQRDSVTKQLRSRHGKRIAEERAARGEQPGFMKGDKRARRKS
jgi:hypothetical protein